MISVSPVRYQPYCKAFLSKKNDNKTLPNENDENPISRKGEIMNLIKATFVGGILLAGRLIWGLADDGEFLLELLADYSEKLTQKTSQKELKKLKENIENEKSRIKNKRILNGIGAFVAILAAGLCGFALLYTIFNAPKIAYESKVNTFKKSKEMDVYIQSNKIEKDLYTKLDEKAQKSDDTEKDKLKEQYMVLKNAKNQVPDFVKLKR